MQFYFPTMRHLILKRIMQICGFRFLWRHFISQSFDEVFWTYVLSKKKKRKGNCRSFQKPKNTHFSENQYILYTYRKSTPLSISTLQHLFVLLRYITPLFSHYFVLIEDLRVHIHICYLFIEACIRSEQVSDKKRAENSVLHLTVLSVTVAAFLIERIWTDRPRIGKKNWSK